MKEGKTILICIGLYTKNNKIFYCDYNGIIQKHGFYFRFEGVSENIGL